MEIYKVLYRKKQEELHSLFGGLFKWKEFHYVDPTYEGGRFERLFISAESPENARRRAVARLAPNNLSTVVLAVENPILAFLYQIERGPPQPVIESVKSVKTS